MNTKITRSRNNGLVEPYSYTQTSMDTTGYSKGKPSYDLVKSEGSGSKIQSASNKVLSTKKVERKDVKDTIKKELKKGGSVKSSKQQAAIAIAMKADGKAPKKKMQYGGKAASMVPSMKKGGSLKEVPADKVGLSKLPTPVRNKMGYAKKGAAMPKKANYGMMSSAKTSMKKGGKMSKRGC